MQNFRAKPGTRMADAPEPDPLDLAWTIVAARHILGPAMSIQAPPNLSAETYPDLIAAGLNDWGGVSPVTPDHVNPEAPWPEIEALARRSAAAGKILVERLAVYPSYALDAERWIDPAIAPAVRRTIDSEGFARPDDWSPGVAQDPPAGCPRAPRVRRSAPTTSLLSWSAPPPARGWRPGRSSPCSVRAPGASMRWSRRRMRSAATSPATP